MTDLEFIDDFRKIILVEKRKSLSLLKILIFNGVEDGFTVFD